MKNIRSSKINVLFEPEKEYNSRSKKLVGCLKVGKNTRFCFRYLRNKIAIDNTYVW